MLPASALAKKIIKHAYLVVESDGVDKIFSNLAAYTLTQGDKVSLAARMYNVNTFPELALGEVPTPQPDTITYAMLEATFPDGRRMEEMVEYLFPLLIVFSEYAFLLSLTDVICIFC